MDYPGWELERQRAALTALLLGRGAKQAEDGSQHGGRDQGGAEDSAAPGTAGEPAGGRSRVSPLGVTAPGPRSAGARDDGRGGAGRLEAAASLSAWEEILGAEPAPDVLARTLQSTEPGEAAAAGMVRERAEGSPGEGTGAWRADEPGRHGRRRTSAWETAARRRLAALEEALSGGAAPGEEPGGQMAPAGMAGGDASAGSRAADGQLEQPVRLRRGGGGVTELWGQDGLPVLSEGEGTGGTAPWGSGWGTAEARAEDGAKALSRAVQRDARRYDGGFTIY